MPQSHLILTKGWLTLGQQSAPHVPLPGHPWVLVREVGSDRVLTKAAVTSLGKHGTGLGFLLSLLTWQELASGDRLFPLPLLEYRVCDEGN